MPPKTKTAPKRELGPRVFDRPPTGAGSCDPDISFINSLLQCLFACAPFYGAVVKRFPVWDKVKHDLARGVARFRHNIDNTPEAGSYADIAAALTGKCLGYTPAADESHDVLQAYILIITNLDKAGGKDYFGKAFSVAENDATFTCDSCDEHLSTTRRPIARWYWPIYPTNDELNSHHCPSGVLTTRQLYAASFTRYTRMWCRSPKCGPDSIVVKTVTLLLADKVLPLRVMPYAKTEFDPDIRVSLEFPSFEEGERDKWRLCSFLLTHPGTPNHYTAVIRGGESFFHINDDLVVELHHRDFRPPRFQIERYGAPSVTLVLYEGIDGAY